MFLFIDDKVILLVDGDYQFDGDALFANDITSSLVNVDSATLTEQSTGDNLTADDLLNQPTVVSPTSLLEIVNIFGSDILSGIPVVDSTDIEQIFNISAEDVLSGNPLIDTAILTPIFERDELFADSISAIPLVYDSLLIQKHFLDLIDILSGIPKIDSSTIDQTNNLLADDIFNQRTILENPSLKFKGAISKLRVSKVIDVFYGESSQKIVILGQSNAFTISEKQTTIVTTIGGESTAKTICKGASKIEL